MKYFLMLIAVLLPHTILCDGSTESEKYQHSLTPSQSLYCNDLNPQSHLDFNMVIQSVLDDDSFNLIINKHESIMQKTFNQSVVLHRITNNFNEIIKRKFSIKKLLI